ncbi:MAG: hypothetical protein ACRC62_15205 [Microcoleus sp.]
MVVGNSSIEHQTSNINYQPSTINRSTINYQLSIVNCQLSNMRAGTGASPLPTVKYQGGHGGTAPTNCQRSIDRERGL